MRREVAGEEAVQAVSSLMQFSSFAILVDKIKVDHLLWAIQGPGSPELTRNATYSRTALCVRVKCDHYSGDNNFKYAPGPHL